MSVATIAQENQLDLICGRFVLPLSRRTYIMGVLNVTPDSFSDGGKYVDRDAALEHARQMAREGADIIDIGGESTRPGSEPVSLSEELRRTIPLIERLSKKLNIPISIDTSKHEVARQAIQKGASMVNDITGLKSDPQMAEVVARSEASVCLMHMKGIPKTMQDSPVYGDLMGEILDGLKESISIALKAGISRDRIVVDPGIGFGKTTEHNLTAINRLSELKILGMPILVGVSRKSFIGNVLRKDTSERLIGTAVASAIAIINGASMIRVHDVKEMKDVARLADAIKEENHVL